MSCEFYKKDEQCINLSVYPNVIYGNNKCLALEVRLSEFNPDDCVHLQLYVPDESPQLYILDTMASRMKVFQKSPDITFKFGTPALGFKMKFKRIVSMSTLTNKSLSNNCLTIICKILHHSNKLTVPNCVYAASLLKPYCPCDMMTQVDKDNCRMKYLNLEYLSTDYAALLKSGMHSDMTIVINKDYFRVHKFILQSRCPQFYDNLIKIKHLKDIYITQKMDAALLSCMLEYIYSGIYIPLIDTKDITEYNKDVIECDNKDIAEHLNAIKSHGLECIVPFNAIIESYCKQQNSIVYEKFYVNYSDLEVNKEHSCFWIGPDTVIHKSDPIIVSLYKCFTYENHVCICFKFELLGQRSAYMDCQINLIRKDYTKQKLKEFKHVFKSFDKILTTKAHIEADPEKILHNNNDLLFEFSIQTTVKRLYSKRIHNLYANTSYSEKIHEMWNDYEKSWKKLYKEKTSADISLIVGTEEVQAHKAILCSRSEVFSKMFQHETLEKQRNIIEIQDIDLDTVNYILKYMYYGSVSSNLCCDRAIWLYIAADKYLLERLKNMCRLSLSNYIYYNEYFYDIRVLALVHNDFALRKITAKVPSTVTEIKLTVLKNDPLYTAALKSLF